MEEEEEKEEEEEEDDEEELTGMAPGQPFAASLPQLILEIVFTHLSVRDLMNCTLVCQRWSTIIKRNKVAEGCRERGRDIEEREGGREVKR